MSTPSEGRWNQRSERPAGTALELRVAPSVTTVVHFDADMERAER